MRRREFLGVLSGGVVAWPLVARAQQGGRVRRIGVLMNVAADDAEGQGRVAAFLQALQQLGWTDGRNVRIDYRWAAGDTGRFQNYLGRTVRRSARHYLASLGEAALIAFYLLDGLLLSYCWPQRISQ